MSDDIYTNLFSEPKNELTVIIKKWQLKLCEGNYCAAALLNYFIYWHTIKLKQQSINKESLHQCHTEKEIGDGILNLFGESTIRKAVRLLENKNVITIHSNPNPRYKFDKTKYYLLQEDTIRKFLKSYKNNKEVS